MQASERLPPADQEIDEVTPELVESAVEVSEQLAMATDSDQETGLLPLDLESTNNVVAQVMNSHYLHMYVHEYSKVNSAIIASTCHPSMSAEHMWWERAKAWSFSHFMCASVSCVFSWLVMGVAVFSGAERAGK